MILIKKLKKKYSFLVRRIDLSLIDLSFFSKSAKFSSRSKVFKNKRKNLFK